MTTTDARMRHWPMHAHLFLDALAPALRALNGVGVELVAAVSTLGSDDPSPWPPFRLAVVVSDPYELEYAAQRIGFDCERDLRGLPAVARGEIEGMELLIVASWRYHQGELP